MDCNKCRWYFGGLKCKTRCRNCKDFSNFILKKKKENANDKLEKWLKS